MAFDPNMMAMLAPMLAGGKGGNNDMLSMLAPMLAGNGGNGDMLSMLAPMLAGKNSNGDMFSKLAPMLLNKNGAGGINPDVLSAFLAKNKETKTENPEYYADYAPYNKFFNTAGSEALDKLRDGDSGNFARIDGSGRENGGGADNMQMIMSLMQMLNQQKTPRQAPQPPKGLPDIKGIAPKKIQNGVEKLLKFGMVFD